MLSTSVLLASLVSSVLASPLGGLSLDKRNNWPGGAPGYDTSDPSVIGPSNADCSREMYSITVEPDLSVFSNVESNVNQTYLTSLFFEFVAALPVSTNFTEQYLSGGAKSQKSYTFKISGTHCKPKGKNGKNNAVQLLVHGIGFDSSYWNFGGPGIPSDVSYVYQAAMRGYSTFRYDRLGTGLSDHPADAYNVVQAATDVAILEKIAAGLRDGSLTGHSYSRIAGVGHSYGSVQLNSLLQKVPQAVESVILTGYTANATAVPLYLTSTAYSTATDVFPERFNTNQLTDAYLTTLAPQTSALNFLYFPYYSEAAATRARATEQPVTQGVLFTFGSFPGVASSYNGNVLVVTGDKDWIFCLGNCYAVPPGSSEASILDFVKPQFPGASGFATYVPANTGHGISAHLSADATYYWIQSWLDSNF